MKLIIDKKCEMEYCNGIWCVPVSVLIKYGIHVILKEDE